MEKSHGMVIVRLSGGLGNQLFKYAAGRRLALKNNVPLKLDIISGFQRDYYRRPYSLKPFLIKEDFASPRDCFLGQIGRLRRWMFRRHDRNRPFEKRSYIQEEFPNFDPRLLKLKVTRKIYLEGCWQSELYFKDIEDVIRKEFQFKVPHEQVNVEVAKKIQDCESICVHVRRLHGVPNMPGLTPLDHSDPRANFIDISYYKKAISFLVERIKKLHFFVFADYPDWARENLRFKDCPVTFVGHNGKDYEDLWLMSLCRYFVIANSSFSWWGAWLSGFVDKIVIAPSKGFDNTIEMMPEKSVII
jgi:hypothetical protein